MAEEESQQNVEETIILPIDRERWDAMYSSSKSLEINSQRDELEAIELHTLDTVWHHLIPFIYSAFATLVCKKGKLRKTAVDGFIRIIHHKVHLCSVATSFLLYITWILSGRYELNQVATTLVYWWFIIECTLLLYTANYRMFKQFVWDFTFWYKTVSITIGVICRQLVFDGTDRYLTSKWHMVSGISFILSYFVAVQIVAALKAYHWPLYLTMGFIVLTSVLNMMQVWQIYVSDYEFTVRFLGHTVSLRHAAMSALTNATVFYLQQFFMDVWHRNSMLQMVRLNWVVDETSFEIFYSGRFNFNNSKSKLKSASSLSRIARMVRSPRSGETN